MDTLLSNNEKIILGRTEKFEMALTRIYWCLMLAFTVIEFIERYVVSYHPFSFPQCYISIAFGVIIVLLNGIRLKALKQGKYENKRFYDISKIIEITVMVIGLNLLYFGQWYYLILLLPVSYISISRGFKYSIPFIIYGYLIQSILLLFIGMLASDIFKEEIGFFNVDNRFFTITAVYIFVGFLSKMTSMVYTQHIETEEESQNLVTQLADKYAQVEIAQREIKSQYEKLKETNIQLEDSNKRLTSSLAEFFTLQQISQAISSIFDQKELLKFVNDVILGVMGASTSTIALYYDTKQKMKVEVSNITSRKDLAIITDHINTKVLLDAMEAGQSIMDNSIESEQYPFTYGRNIKSILCVPLQAKGRMHGLVLIEHNMTDAFDEDNLRLLEIIGQQVSIAIENAKLYQQMHELATRDGLTKIFNRIYFQTKLAEELDNAEYSGYDLSVILFDIDHFKRFNDTYGHMFGDKVLVSITRRVHDLLRKDDIFARYGGEEFIILMPHTDLESAYEKAEELRKKVESCCIKDQLISASVTVSMGVSSYPKSAISGDSLLKSADDALYKAKDDGRNCVRTARTL